MVKPIVRERGGETTYYENVSSSEQILIVCPRVVKRSSYRLSRRLYDCFFSSDSVVRDKSNIFLVVTPHRQIKI